MSLPEQANTLWDEMQDLKRKLDSLFAYLPGERTVASSWISEYQTKARQLIRLQRLMIATGTDIESFHISGNIENMPSSGEIQEAHVQALTAHVETNVRRWTFALARQQTISRPPASPKLPTFPPQPLPGSLSAREQRQFIDLRYGTRWDCLKMLRSKLEPYYPMIEKNEFASLVQARNTLGVPTAALLAAARRRLLNDKYEMYTDASEVSLRAAAVILMPGYVSFPKGIEGPPLIIDDVAGINTITFVDKTRLTKTGHASRSTYKPGDAQNFATIQIYKTGERTRSSYEVGQSILHEIGHHVYQTQLTDVGRAHWKQLTLDHPPVVSPVVYKYPEADRPEEAFCEAYRFYRSGAIELFIKHHEQYNFMAERLLLP